MSDRPAHLFFDCDPGCDDAVAIAYVLKKAIYSRIDFLTVAGNVAVEQTTENVRRILAACGITKESTNPKSFIYPGCSRSLMTDEPSAASVHGRDGLGDAPNSLIRDNEKLIAMSSWLEVEPLSAVERLLQVSRESQGDPFDLLCTGPLTNLATALSLMRPQERRAFFKRCRGFVVMGGVFDSLGNITHSAEFNLFADPAAAQIVLSILKQQLAERPDATPSMCFVSLDSTEQVGISLQSVENENATPTQALKFLRYALNQYGQFHVFSSANRPNEIGIHKFEKDNYVRAMLGGSSGASELQPFCYLHDGLAAWTLVEGLVDQVEDIDSWKPAEIRIDSARGESRGRVIICPHNRERGPVGFPSLGTAVKWFKLNTVTKQEFLKEIRTLLAVPDPERVSGS